MGKRPYTAKKQRKIRMIALLSLAILVMSVYFGSGLIMDVRFRNAIMTSDVSTFQKWTYDGQDSGDTSGFTDADINVTGFRKVAENSGLCLLADDTQKGIKLLDKRSGHIWSGSVDGESLWFSDISEGIQAKMQSMLIFSYIDLIGAGAIERETNSYTEPHELTTEKIANGIRYNFNFMRLNIKLSVEIMLEGERLRVKVPSDSIYENEAGSEDSDLIRKETQDSIAKIRSNCDRIDGFANKQEGFSSTYKQLITLSTGNILQSVLVISGQIGSGDLSVDQLQESLESVEMLMSILGEWPEMTQELTSLEESLNKVMELGKQLAENRTTGITKLYVMPYFGSQTSETDGYAFYPDKSGAISFFNKPHSVTAGRYYQDVYDQFLQIVPLSGNQETEEVSGNYINPSSMPVYGVKAFESAFLAILSEGEYDSAIGYDPATPALDHANIYSCFYLRRKTTLTNEGGYQNEIYDNLRTRRDWETTYCLLTGEDADYSGMARVYQQYLLETGRLERSGIMDGKMPLAIDFFMGAKQRRNAIQSRYIKMTDYSFITEYLKDLDDSGIERVLLNISGWTPNYGVRNPDIIAPVNANGGKKGLASLADSINSGNNILTMSIDGIWGQRNDLQSILIEKATVKTKNQLTVFHNGNHIMNPWFIYNKAAGDTLERLSMLGSGGVYFRDIGKSLYYDYNYNAPADRQDTAMIFRKTASRYRESEMTVVMEQANDYLLGVTDWNMGISSQDSRYLFTDESIPFYQMLIHGFMIYTDEGDHLRYDQKIQELKSIEYGYIPFYNLVQEEPHEIRNAGYSGFKAGVAENWFERIVSQNDMRSKELASVWNRKMVHHLRISPDISRTTYDNGMKVYVNYSDYKVTVEGYEIEALTYKIVGPGGIR